MALRSTDVVDGLAQHGRGRRCGGLREYRRLFSEPADEILDHAQARIQRGSIRYRDWPDFHACQCPARRFNRHHAAEQTVSANGAAQRFGTVAAGVQFLVKPQTLDRGVRQFACLPANVLWARRHLEGRARDDEPHGQTGRQGKVF